MTTATAAADYPFLWGAQYYRAPTPGPDCWEADLRRMRELGFRDAKFWVQWRWSERRPGEYYWDDLDRLMQLAEQNGLRVTLNLILDTSPQWLFEQHPDAYMIDARGLQVPCKPNVCRQIGGYPGPCYSHPQALAARQRFFAAAAEHFRAFPALAMWDVWNEPEHSLHSRAADALTQVCYCPHCQAAFRNWLRRKYQTIEKLNAVWGRCYWEFTECEAPVWPHCVADFIDWREFHLDKMAGEAAWRLDTVKQHDPKRVRYLHVVPDTTLCFNPVTGVDDFQVAESCQVFGASMNNDPFTVAQVVSAAQGRVAYNAEWHVNWGMTSLHPRIIELPLFLREILPQLGWGVKGFLFWQFHAEVLGIEAPAWGLVRTDGSDRPVTRAARDFMAKLAPHLDALRQAEAPAARAPIGVWRSRANDLFHFAMHDNFQSLAADVTGFINSLYWNNLPLRIVSGQQLAAGALDGLRLLILPCGYYLGQAEAQALDAWVRAGGVLLGEAHTGGYDADRNRHSTACPGLGLAASWGLREEEATSSFHLSLEQKTGGATGATGDALKALQAAGGATGDEFFPFTLTDGTEIWGARQFAALAGDNLTVEGTFNGVPCLVSKAVGKGRLFYAGTRLGQAAAAKDGGGLRKLLLKVAAVAGVTPAAATPAGAPESVRVDVLRDPVGAPAFLVTTSRGQAAATLVVPGVPGRWRGLYLGGTGTAAADGVLAVELPAGQAELWVRDPA
ncbi:MAG: alpha-amylase family protein [Lentisphaeria bacterium]